MKKVISKHLLEILNKEKDMNLSRSGWISNKHYKYVFNGRKRYVKR